MRALIDSNVLLDILTEDPDWFEWSSNTIIRYAEDHVLAINPIIYAEVSVNFPDQQALENALPSTEFKQIALPWHAAFQAGKAFLRYRQTHKGQKRSPLPDFYIGAHASAEKMILITRDATRYRTYFPELQIESP